VNEPPGLIRDLREERRPITALFADLVGSTSLGERLDDSELRLVVGEAVARMVVEIQRLGGHVKDLAGDGLLAFFGAPLASEDDAERAILAALAIVEAIEAYATEVAKGWGVDGVGVRVGVTTGPVVTGALGAGDRVEYAAFGNTVNTAARLQSVAPPGTVLVDTPTRRLVEPLYDWGESSTHQFKGLSQPTDAHRPLRPRPHAEKARGLAGVDTPLVGRERELGQLIDALDGLRDGAGGVVFILGEAGIGKTRLLAELHATYEGSWLEGRCVSYGASLPYWPFRDLLRDWLGAADDDPELRVRVRLRRALNELFGARTLEIYPYLCSLLGLVPEPDAAERLADLAPEALQYRTFEVVDELLVRLAADRPLVLLIDDLHWADPTSVQLVERLLAIGEHAAVLLVIAQRDERDHPSWGVRERAAREVPHLSRELDLAPLTGSAERDLLEAIVGADTLPPEVQAQLLETAEGNPFYLEELVRSLIDLGALARDDGRWRFDHAVPIDVPPTVERVVLARIDRLTPQCHHVLTAASALGRLVSLPLLEAVVEPGDEIDPALHELQRLDLLRATRRWPQPEFRFKHALIQDAAYRTLVPDRRRRFHQRAAAWLEARYTGRETEVLGLLAHHWLEAGDEGKAVAYLSRAGDQARLEWSLDEAVGHYRRLLPLLERRGARQEMAISLFKLALALHQDLRFAEANEVYQRAFEAWTPPLPSDLPAATLRVGQLGLPDDADPHNSHRIANIQLFMSLFDRLVEAWPDRTIVPSIAERWEISGDGLRYLFHLRDGLTWSDGQPLTAHDVEYGVKRALDRGRPGPSVAIFFVLEHARDYLFGEHDDLSRVGVRALDERTLEFRLTVPAPYFLYVMNRPDAAPHPRHAIEAHGAAWTEPGRQVVSGAYARARHDQGRIDLVRRPESPMPRVGNVQRVKMEQFSREAAAESYLRGELDLFNGQFEFSAALAEAVPDEVNLDPPAYLVYLTAGFDHPTLAQPAFRRALAHAIDRERLAAVAPPNAIVATGGVVPPPLQGHTPDIAPDFDPDRARAELRRSGVSEGVEVEVLGDARTDVAAFVTAVAAGWEDVLGLRFPVRTMTMEQFSQSASAALRWAGWFPGYPDPEYYLRLLLHSDALDNHGRYSSARFDGLIERARAEQDGRLRLELFHEADRVAVADEVAIIPLLYMRNVIVVKPWVHGWWEYGKTWSSFADLRVDAHETDR
jgi:ABC-type oligopeptide transport system substrate-binding subunit/class 3 adenylate cyclase